MKFLSLLLVIISLTTLLCSCTAVARPQGPEGLQGPQGEAGKDGASFLTGKGEPSNDLGNIGDSYLDVSSYKWGFYIKDESGWNLLGYLEAEPAPLNLNDLNGSYVLSHIVSGSRVYNIGDVYADMTLSGDMIQVELNEGVGNLTVNFATLQATNITCTIEYDKLIMICENAINITGQPSSVYELSIVQGSGLDNAQEGEIYVILEAYGDYYYVKKVDNSGDENNNSSENKNQDIEIILHTEDGDYNITEDNRLCSNILWEPGYIKTLYLSVKNNSSIDLNYMISIEATDIVKNLNEVIAYIITPDATLDSPVSKDSLDWSAGKYLAGGSNIVTQEITLMSGEEHFFALSLRMDETAGNEYIGGHITFNIKAIKENPSSEDNLK